MIITNPTFRDCLDALRCNYPVTYKGVEYHLIEVGYRRMGTEAGSHDLFGKVVPKIVLRCNRNSRSEIQVQTADITIKTPDDNF